MVKAPSFLFARQNAIRLAVSCVVAGQVAADRRLSTRPRTLRLLFAGLIRGFTMLLVAIALGIVVISGVWSGPSLAA